MTDAVSRPEPDVSELRSSTTWFRVFYVACIVALSLQTMWTAHGLRDHHAWLPALEIVGALLLLARRLQLVGLAILLGVYLVATVITLHAGHVPVYLAFYAGTAIFLVQSDWAAARPRA